MKNKSNIVLALVAMLWWACGEKQESENCTIGATQCDGSTLQKCTAEGWQVKQDTIGSPA